MTARIRELREGRGWTQQQLADRAGVTRQLVGAVEAGRQSPNVAAAIGLARALGATVEALFDPPAAVPVAVLGDLPTAATAVLTARVGERVVAVPAPHRAVNPERWTAADALCGGGGLRWLPEGRTDGLVVAGCDPVLGLLADLVERSSGHRVLGVHASTGRSLEALVAGTVHGVMVHGRPGSLPQPPVRVRRWQVARWQVGLASPGGPPSVSELVERRGRVVQRDPGAGSQQALRRALARAGVQGPLPGPVADGHLDVARRVRGGGVRAGVTMEAAARAFGLAFAALEEHTVELWIDQRWTDLAAVTSLGEVLASAAFLRRAETLDGYDVTAAGTER